MDKVKNYGPQKQELMEQLNALLREMRSDKESGVNLERQADDIGELLTLYAARFNQIEKKKEPETQDKKLGAKKPTPDVTKTLMGFFTMN